MSWLFLVLFSACLNASVNHLDKYLIQKYLKGGGIGALVIFSALMGLPVFLLIVLFTPAVFFLKGETALLIILNGMIYVAWLLPYFYALEKDEVSVVTPLFQLTPICTFILGYLFLGETMTLIQVSACLLILLGSVTLTLKFNRKQEISFNQEVYGLMFLASALVAVNGVLFKYFAIRESFWVVSFWEYVGFFATAILLFMFIPTYRRQFMRVIQLNRISILGINFFNEVLAILAKISLNYASLLTAVSLVFFVSEGLQPFFVLALGILLTLFFPKISRERLEKKYLTRKLVSIAAMFLGVYLLQI